jgi:hypothetical protein
MNYVGRYHDVLIDELSLVGIVCKDAPNLCGGEKDIFRLFPLKECLDISLTGQVEFSARSGNEICITFRHESAEEGRAHQTTMAGDKDFTLFFHG